MPITVGERDERRGTCSKEEKRKRGEGSWGTEERREDGGRNKGGRKEQIGKKQMNTFVCIPSAERRSGVLTSSVLLKTVFICNVYFFIYILKKKAIQGFGSNSISNI